jgi:CheY-like chemotaxis protein
VLRRRLRDGVPPGAILLDCQAGGGATLALARAVRQVAGAELCPVIAMASTYSVASLHQDSGGAAPAGGQPLPGAIDAVLTKPLTASTLYNAVIEARRKRASLKVGARAGRGKQQLAGIRLLVVDDSDINREVARRILSDQGAAVALADDGSAAVAWLEEHGDAVDLVLMDVQMPVMYGIEATRRLRAMARFAKLPIVALTAGAFQTHHDEARAAGMTDFITKPFDIPLTMALIRRLTGRQPEDGGFDRAADFTVDPAAVDPAAAAQPP